MSKVILILIICLGWTSWNPNGLDKGCRICFAAYKRRQENYAHYKSKIPWHVEPLDWTNNTWLDKNGKSEIWNTCYHSCASERHLWWLGIVPNTFLLECCFLRLSYRYCISFFFAKAWMIIKKKYCLYINQCLHFELIYNFFFSD